MSSENRIGIEEARKRLGDLTTAVQQGGNVIITRNGKPTARLVQHGEAPMNTLPTLSETTRIAVAALVDATVEHEYGRGDRAAARRSAHTALTAELGGDHTLADIHLRILIRDGLVARTCQCRQLHPNGCPHGSPSGSIWCTNHYEADVPALSGALLCGACHVVEFQGKRQLST